MNSPVFVHYSRLTDGVFDLRKGDIAAAYSAPVIGGDGKGNVSVFRHDGRLWTNGGGGSSLYRTSAACYPLISPEDYSGADNVPYSYEGRTVTCQRTFRLGAETEFRASDRSISEWQGYLRRAYERGGHFTHEKTYHALLREFLNRDYWDTDTRSYQQLSGNVVSAIRLELAEPDYDKRTLQSIPPPSAQAQLTLL